MSIATNANVTAALADDVIDCEIATKQAAAAAWSVIGHTSGGTRDALQNAMRSFRRSAAAWYSEDESIANVETMRVAITAAWATTSDLVAAMASTSNDRKVRVLADMYVAAVAYRKALEAANV